MFRLTMEKYETVAADASYTKEQVLSFSAKCSQLFCFSMRLILQRIVTVGIKKKYVLSR